MQELNSISLSDAVVVWINSREIRLSASTERAYRGEVDRLAQFFAKKYGCLALNEFTHVHWEDYLDELRGVRQHVVTCRGAQLSGASAEQAIRISAAFLRWARDEGLLTWAPRAAQTSKWLGASSSRHRKPLVDLSIHTAPMHPALKSLLLSPPADDGTLGELRAQLAIGLAYWGGLRSSEIAALKIVEIAVEGLIIELCHPRQKSMASIRGNVAVTWQQYRIAREEAGAVLTRQSPVVAALGSNEPISAWSVWSLIAQHIADVTGDEKHHSAQSLHRSRVEALGARCIAEIDELAKYTGRINVDFTPPLKAYG